MKSLKFVILVALFMMIRTGSASAWGKKAVTVTNNTSYTMNEFYVSASDDTGWDSSVNLIAGQSLAPGQVTTINIVDGLEVCHYDLMAVLYGAAQRAYQYRVNACHNGNWTIQ